MSENLEQKTNDEVSVPPEVEETMVAVGEGVLSFEEPSAEQPVSAEATEAKSVEKTDNGNVELSTEPNGDTKEGKKKSKKPLIFILAGAVVAVAVIVGVILIFALNAKSEEAKRVDSIISDIGTVTLDSGKKIREAENQVKSLGKDDYDQLDNLGELEEARKTYDGLVLQSKADKIIAKIDEIGEVTLDSKDKIDAARSAYDLAEEPVQKLVTNYKKLTDAESKYAEAVDASFASQAATVIKLINDIGTVTEKSEDKIKKAEDAYDKLPSEAQEKVTNYSTLTSARAKWTELKKKSVKSKMDAALSKLTKEYDSVTGITWYYPSSTPQYINERSYVLAYIGMRSETDAWICLKTNYYGKDWVFYKKLIINADGKRYQKSLSYFDVDHDTQRGTVTEHYDKASDDIVSDLVWLSAIADASDAVVRFQGDSHSYDLTVPGNDKEGLKQVIAAYEAYMVYKVL